jgi:hypothetical protein
MIILFGFFFNLLWEVAHSLLYDWNSPPLINDIYVYCPRIIFFATLFDAVWIFTFILWNSLIRRKFDWLLYPQKRDFIVFVGIGIIQAIFIELFAVIFNQWEYNQFMPVIFGIGLTPLIQLALTSSLSLYLSSKIQWINIT